MRCDWLKVRKICLHTGGKWLWLGWFFVLGSRGSIWLLKRIDAKYDLVLMFVVVCGRLKRRGSGSIGLSGLLMGGLPLELEYCVVFDGDVYVDCYVVYVDWWDCWMLLRVDWIATL